jgi:predicted nucleic acid-binding protein
MTLVDTNVLVALLDERDRLHQMAVRDLKSMTGPFATTSIVLSETCFLLPEAHFRDRLRMLIARIPIQLVELDTGSWDAVFTWLANYSEHTPDLCDAQLIVLAHDVSSSIWTYDSEFHQLWRAPDGRPLRVLPSSTRRTPKRRAARTVSRRGRST